MKLSILIAAYNVEKFIQKCIQSCYEEDLKDQYEIIVVNDGSTDSTLSIVNQLKNNIINLCVINQENSGLGAARNAGIKNAIGKYIWMIDGDDYLPQNTIGNILDNLAINYDCYGINYNLVAENETLLRTKYPSNYIDKVYSGSEFYSKYYYDSYTWQFIFKREIFVKNLLKFQARINMQDSEIFPKIMYYTQTVAYIDLIAYNYVQQENSFTNTINPTKRFKYFESIVTVKKSLESFAEKIQSKDQILYEGIMSKIFTLNEVILSHLVFYKYDRNTLKKIIQLLSENNLYPVKSKVKGKLLLIQYALNIQPILTKKIVDFIR